MKKIMLILASLLSLLTVACQTKDKPENGPGKDTEENPAGKPEDHSGETGEDPDKSAELGVSPIDLGLSVEWASVNLGARNPYDYGNVYDWGETRSPNKDNYQWASYKYGNSGTTLSKYNDTDGLTMLELSDDAAHFLLGGKWRMPTTDDWEELKQQCNWTWTTREDGHNGATVTATNGESIFLPAAGGKTGGSFLDVGKDGFYWTSSLVKGSVAEAWTFYFHKKTSGVSLSFESFWRYYAFPIRAVKEREKQ